MDNQIEKNRQILIDAVKKIGKSRLPFDVEDIDKLSNSKSFDFVDYLKKMVILNRSIDSDTNLKIETDLTKEYNLLLEERATLEEEGNDLSKNKRYQNIKAKTETGLSFFLLQGYFNPKTLNKITKENPEVEYKLDMEIDRRSRKSTYYKNDKDRAICNSIVNVFRDEFPKAKSIGINRTTLCLDEKGQSGSKIAAKSIGMLCESGILSNLVTKMSNRIDSFNERFKIPEKVSNNKFFKGAKNIMAIAASAAIVAILGNEGFEIMNNAPMIPIADLGVRETLEVLASVDIPETAKNVVDFAKEIPSDIVQVSGVDVNALNITDKGTAISKEDIEILDFMTEKDNIGVVIEKGMTLIDLAKEQLTNPSNEEIHQFVSAVSEYNDIDNPNLIIENVSIEIPHTDYINEFTNNTFEIISTNKKEILEEMKNVTINYGETQSELIEKLSSAMKDNNILNNSQLTSFKNDLKEAIPTDLKAFDENVTESIKEIVEKVEKLQNKSQFKIR